jgi:hypothetical protein
MGAGTEGLAFTVDAQVAFADPGIEFINVLHPLVEIIRADYEDELRSRVSAQHVALETSQLPAGKYVFVVYRLKVDGARKLNFLEAVVVDQRLEDAADRETAEVLLGEMVEAGKDAVAGPLTLDHDFARSASAAAEAAFLKRLQSLRVQLEEDNALLVDRRVTSIRFHIERQLARKRDLLGRQEAEGKAQRILQLTRGQITKLEGELLRQLQELEAHRRLEVGYDEVAAGILEVVK